MVSINFLTVYSLTLKSVGLKIPVSPVQPRNLSIIHLIILDTSHGVIQSTTARAATPIPSSSNVKNPTIAASDFPQNSKIFSNRDHPLSKSMSITFCNG